MVLLFRLIANVHFPRTSLSVVGSRDDQDRSRRGPQYVGGDAAQPQAIYLPEPPPTDRDEGGLSAFFGRLQDDRGCFALPHPDPQTVPELAFELPRALLQEQLVPAQGGLGGFSERDIHAIAGLRMVAGGVVSLVFGALLL